MSSHLHDFEQKDSDVLDTRELNVSSGKENVGLFCKVEDYLDSISQPRLNMGTKKNMNKKHTKLSDFKCKKKIDIIFSERKDKLDHWKEVHGFKYIPIERIKRRGILRSE